MRLLIFFLVMLFPAFLWADCPDLAWHKTVTLKKINDGDTVTLDSGELVRFIGINSPEIDHINISKSQPFALAAKEALAGQIKKGDKLRLIFDHTRRDKYGRLLAYVFTQTGQNLALLQLKSGFAQHWVIGKNDLLWLCFQAAEQQARSAKKGIWANFRPLKAGELSEKDKGYQYIVGEISELKETKKSLEIILDGNLTVKLDKKNVNFFETSGTKIQLHNSILLTGNLKWIAGQLQLTITHPAQILP
ncbi:thermonuclease family protein [Psychromonas sp.]|uniref:thermonuclease family protein n=1 Tax=Psychromonas sp. TaxID=1884585 RepID=UPI003566AA60